MTNDYGNLELHQVLLAAMKDIDKICRTHGLRYYLYAGTLLGALNYGGFIPWDDDIDLVMFPEDFDKLSEIIRAEYGDRYEISTFDTDPNWFSKMNKIYVKGTQVLHKHGGESHPIFIDVSKLHNVPDETWRRTIQRKQIELINLVLAVQSGSVVPTSLISKLTLGNLAKINKAFWGRMLDMVMMRYDKKSTQYVGIMCNTLTKNPYTGRTGYETDLTKRVWHEDAVDVMFEGTALMTFSGIEEYLNYQFGPKWAEPYPEEKRISKHGMLQYSISKKVQQWVGEQIG